MSVTFYDFGFGEFVPDHVPGRSIKHYLDVCKFDSEGAVHRCFIE